MKLIDGERWFLGPDGVPFRDESCSRPSRNEEQASIMRFLLSVERDRVDCA